MQSCVYAIAIPQSGIFLMKPVRCPAVIVGHNDSTVIRMTVWMSQYGSHSSLRFVICQEASDINIKNDVSVQQQKIILYLFLQIEKCSRSSQRCVFFYIANLYIPLRAIFEIITNHMAQMSDN